jgi:hypothetical protein
VAVVTDAAAGATGIVAEACTTCELGVGANGSAGCCCSDFIEESCDNGVAAFALLKVDVCSRVVASPSRFGNGIVAVDISRCLAGATTECSPAPTGTAAAAWPEYVAKRTCSPFSV